MQHRILGTLAMLAATFGVLLVTTGAIGSDPPPNPPSTPPASPPAEECEPLTGQLDVGSSFEGEPAREIHLCEPPETGRPGPGDPPTTATNMIAVTYGDCEVEDFDDGGCSPPVQVQNFPACERNLDRYEQNPGPEGPRLPSALFEVRGTEAALFDDGDAGVMLEIYIAGVTTVVFADTEDTALEIASELSGVVGDLLYEPGQDFPVGSGHPEDC